ncbi:hypothetical protein ACJJTC_001886 [Scirpophaga incertulas]
MDKLLNFQKRHRADDETNRRKVEVQREGHWVPVRWEALQVGDVCKVLNNQFFPADLVLLASSEPQGISFIETSNLDGETNLKVRQAHGDTARLAHGHAATLTCEPPNRHLYEFCGSLKEANARRPTPGDVLPRGWPRAAPPAPLRVLRLPQGGQRQVTCCPAAGREPPHWHLYEFCGSLKEANARRPTPGDVLPPRLAASRPTGTSTSSAAPSRRPTPGDVLPPRLAASRPTGTSTSSAAPSRRPTPGDVLPPRLAASRPTGTSTSSAAPSRRPTPGDVLPRGWPRAAPPAPLRVLRLPQGGQRQVTCCPAAGREPPHWHLYEFCGSLKEANARRPTPGDVLPRGWPRAAPPAPLRVLRLPQGGQRQVTCCPAAGREPPHRHLYEFCGSLKEANARRPTPGDVLPRGWPRAAPPAPLRVLRLPQGGQRQVTCCPAAGREPPHRHLYEFCGSLKEANASRPTGTSTSSAAPSRRPTPGDVLPPRLAASRPTGTSTSSAAPSRRPTPGDVLPPRLAASRPTGTSTSSAAPSRRPTPGDVLPPRLAASRPTGTSTSSAAPSRRPTPGDVLPPRWPRAAPPAPLRVLRLPQGGQRQVTCCPRGWPRAAPPAPLRVLRLPQGGQRQVTCCPRGWPRAAPPAPLRVLRLPQGGQRQVTCCPRGWPRAAPPAPLRVLRLPQGGQRQVTCCPRGWPRAAPPAPLRVLRLPQGGQRQVTCCPRGWPRAAPPAPLRVLRLPQGGQRQVTCCPRAGREPPHRHLYEFCGSLKEANAR